MDEMQLAPCSPSPSSSSSGQGRCRALAPCSPSASSSCSGQGGCRRVLVQASQRNELVAPTTQGVKRRAVVRTKAEAKLELRAMERQARFSAGMERHLAAMLRTLEWQEQKLLERLAPPPLLQPLTSSGGSDGRRPGGMLPQPQTPPLQHLLAFDPLAHLSSPLSPLELDDHSDAEVSEAEELRGEDSDAQAALRMGAKRPRTSD
eukprot:gb/GFBE01044499.1/.p1 GENE.gb/GFBE01044499.1/~~gb/GFBE01044499.1/.p1  ORF type:complete len:205 (+),score=39.96 gb/GFBE01044499.1/:1-615(+)